MKRTLLGALAAGVLLLSAACGSSTPGAASAPSSSSSSSSSSQAAGGGSDSSSSSDDSSGPSTTKTIGGSLDDQSTAWFSTMCDGLKSLTSLTSSMQSAGAGASGPDAMKGAADSITQAGQAMSSTADKLASIPPPTIENGADFAGTFIKALKAFGTDLQSAGQKMASGDTSGLSDIETQSEGIAKDLDSFKPSADLQKQILAIPSCKDSGLDFSS